MKEQGAGDIASRATGKEDAKLGLVAMDSSAETPAIFPAATNSLVEGDTSNGGPKVAVALLSLGQDLTKGEAAAVASAAALVSRPGRPRKGDLQDQSQNPLELVETSEIPMLAIDIGKVGQTAAMNADNDAKSKKRKRSKSKGNKNVDGNPPDFWHWLSPGDNIGNWDVLCGRGGESNNYIGNKKYRKVVGERKEEYRKIDVKQRKLKTNFVRDIVQHIKNSGGRFIDVNSEGKYYVVTDDKARKKTSQALRETKELKWLIDTYDDDQKEDTNKKKTIRNKDVVCPFCKKKGHKTRIAKACQKHHEWLDINNSSTKAALGSANKDISSSKNKSSKIIAVS